MTVVCDASPIIAFASLKRLDILKALFEKVIIPEAVADEVFTSQDPSSIRSIKMPPFMSVVPISNRANSQTLALQLHRGESEAIVLSLEMGISHIILDDKSARDAASHLGLSVIGTAGILLLAKEKGLISSVSDSLNHLHNDIHFRLSSSVLQRIKIAAQE